MKKKIRTPMQCRNLDEICKIPRDNIDLPENFWMITDSYEVTIAQQEIGKKASQSISIPKRIFDSCVRWYVTGQKRGKIKF